MGYNHLVIKVGFQPGGLFRLLGIPMNEFQADERVHESANLLGNEIPLIVEQLNEATSFENIVAIIQKWLLGKLQYLRKELPIDKALPISCKKAL